MSANVTESSHAQCELRSDERTTSLPGTQNTVKCRTFRKMVTNTRDCRSIEFVGERVTD